MLPTGLENMESNLRSCTDPYGTPCFRTILSEWTDPMETHCDLSVKYERIQDNAEPDIPKEYWRLFKITIPTPPPKKIIQNQFLFDFDKRNQQKQN